MQGGVDAVEGGISYRNSSNILFPFSYENLKPHFEESDRGKYLFKYLNELNAKTCILESKYIDKDYMIDYQKFYSRAFEEYDRSTKRIHFFDKTFSDTDFQKALNGEYEQLNKSYLGFVVVKPVYIVKKKPLIGRTLLRTYSHKEGNKNRFFIREKYHASLFGIPLNVDSLPFQDQDLGVGMCATIALWSALQPLVNPYGIPSQSPAEITEIATLRPSPSRRFPSEEGLNVYQMVKYIQSTGLDVEVIRANEENIPFAVKAYINARLPLIALLAFKKNSESECTWHAVVISGYKCDERRNIEELYVHDDGIGPYSKVKPINNNFKLWNNEWISREEEGYEGEYDTCELYEFFVPVYSKIRLTFPRIFLNLQKKKDEAKSSWTDLELYLYTIRKYKKYLISYQIKNKMDILTTFLPRFLWVIRTHHKNSPLRDDIYDATSVYVRHCKTVEYL
jgi:hypothetical protein